MADIQNMRILLELQKIFTEQSDEEHKLSTSELIQKLQLKLSLTDTIDKRRIKRYIDVLNDSGFDVIEDVAKFGKKVYSQQVRVFETYELRMLVDAVISAKFISDSQKKTIINKLKKLTSEHIAKSLPSSLKYVKSINHIDKMTKVYIDSIRQAIEKRHAIKFKYGKYNLDREFVLQREGKEYIYYPYDLIWEQGQYYVVGQKDNKGGLSNYRVDRMRNVEVIDERFKRLDYDIETYMQTNFNMFSGSGEWVEIEFRKAFLINPIIDKFGMDAEIKKVDESTFILKTKAIVGPGFFNWICSWGSDVKVIAPESAVSYMKEEAKKIMKLYERAVDDL
ncbi:MULTISPECIES: helix-turn-helix transcriptional regulator [Bacillus]|uniref:helix-turn-helix transcriptional regulator n=1 Tax=Bacillus TaxID=1386 RepID=UPI000BB7270B|nr:MULTISPECIES: WYL domain-containing protein [Bacillus]